MATTTEGVNQKARTREPWLSERARTWLQVIVTTICTLAVYSAVTNIRAKHGPHPLAVSEATLAGHWVLQSIDQAPVGPDSDSSVLSQEVAFANGAVHGVTRLRASSDAATVNMPFPDESVTRVDSSVDGHEVRVAWDGSYRFLDNNRIDLTVGKASYIVVATVSAGGKSLSFDHDTMLTLKGVAVYAPQSNPEAGAQSP